MTSFSDYIAIVVYWCITSDPTAVPTLQTMACVLWKPASRIEAERVEQG